MMNPASSAMDHLFLIGLPLLALSAFWFLPLAFAPPAFVVLIAAAFMFYAYLAKVARRLVMTGVEAKQHALGRVRSLQGDIATVWVNNELWFAQEGEVLHEGDQVEVVGVDGLRLHVRKVNPGASEEPDGKCHG